MTEQEIAAIQERLDGATPGPWAVDARRPSVWSLGPTGRILAKFAHFHPNGAWESTVQDDANAAFVAHTRDDVERLLADLAAWRVVGREIAAGQAMCFDDFGRYCGFCDAETDKPHVEGCLVLHTRELLERGAP